MPINLDNTEEAFEQLKGLMTSRILGYTRRVSFFLFFFFNTKYTDSVEDFATFSHLLSKSFISEEGVP